MSPCHKNEHGEDQKCVETPMVLILGRETAILRNHKLGQWERRRWER
jgi:hypothetical protein